MDMNEATAKAIASERSAAGLTIKRLAECSGVPQRTLIRMLKNERDIKVTQLEQLAKVFGIYPHELIVSAEAFIERERRGPVTLGEGNPGELSEQERTDYVLDKIANGNVGLAASHDPNKWAEAAGGDGR
jgi:transcriptional regulator with XRE-family HTH domain